MLLWTGYFYGWIDDFFYYNYPLGQEEVLAHLVLPRPPVYELTFSHDPRLIQNPNLRLNYTYQWTDMDDRDPSNITQYHNGHLLLTGDMYIDLEAQAGNDSVGATAMPRIGGANSGANGTLPMGWSIEVLFKALTVETYADLLDFGDDTLTDNIILGWPDSGNRLIFEWGDGTGAPQVMNVIDNAHNNTWYHVVVVMTPGTTAAGNMVTAYVDGNRTRGVTGVTLPRAVNRPKAYIGKSPWGYDYFDAYLDTFRLYDYSLTAAEVRDLYTVTHEALPNASEPVQSYVYHTAPVVAYTFSKRPTGLMVEGTNYRWDDSSRFRYPHEGVALFNGAGEYINLAVYPSDSGAVLPMLGSSFSLSVWVWWDAVRLYSRVIDLGSVAGYSSHNILLAQQAVSNNLIFEVYSGDRWSQVLCQDCVEVGRWTHVVASVEQLQVNDTQSAQSGRLRLFIDGRERAMSYGYAPQLVARPSAYIGRSNWPADAYLAAAIDALYVYDYALSLEQVAAHHVTPRPPVFELGFSRDPRPWVKAEDGLSMQPLESFSYSWQQFAADDWLSNSTQVHAGHLSVLGEQWVNLSAVTGPHSLGTALTGVLFGQGSGDVMADGRFRGWSLEIVVRLERQEVGAKLFDFGATPVSGPFQDNVGMGYWDAQSRMNLYVYGGPSGTTGLAIPVIDQVELHRWYHLLIVMRPSAGGSGRADVQVYVDGEALPPSNDYLPWPRAVPRPHCTLAKSPWQGDAVLDMALDTFRIYDFALTPDTAMQLYALQLVDASALQVQPLWHAQPLLSYTFDVPPSARELQEGTSFTWLLGAFPHTGVASFDGRTEFINLMTFPDDTGTPFPTVLGNASFSVEAWVMWQSYARWSRVLDVGNGVQGDNILLANVDTTGRLAMHVYLQDNATLRMGSVETAQAPLTLGRWHHVVATLDDLTRYPANRMLDPMGSAAAWLRLYVDGALWAEQLSPRPRAVARTLAYMGKSHWGADELLHGQVDALYLYDVALSAEQVAVHRAVPRPPHFDLAFDSDPRWWLGGTAGQYTYGWQDFDPRDALSNQTRFHSGHLVLTGASRELSYVNLSALTGYSSIGLALPRIGGAQSSGLAGTEVGWTFELVVKLSTVGKWAKLLDWGSPAAPGWPLDNIVVGYLGESSTLEFRVWNSLKGNDASTYVNITAVQLDRWYHIVVVVQLLGDPLSYDAKYEAFVDGQLTNTNGMAYYPQQVRRPSALLGRTNWGYSDDAPFACQLDALRVYDYAAPRYIVAELWRVASDPNAVPPSRLPSSSAAPAVRASSSSAPMPAMTSTPVTPARSSTLPPTVQPPVVRRSSSSTSAAPKRCPGWALGVWEPSCRCPDYGTYPSCWCPEPQEGMYPYCDDEEWPVSSSTGVMVSAAAGPSSSLIAGIVVALLLMAAAALFLYFKYCRVDAGKPAQGDGGESRSSSLLGHGRGSTDGHSDDYHAHTADTAAHHHTNTTNTTNSSNNTNGHAPASTGGVELL